MSYFNEMTEEEKALAKQIRRENIKETIGCILFAIGMAILIVLYMFATPDQYTAERDLIAEQLSNSK